MKIKSNYLQTLICLLILSLNISCSKSSQGDIPTPPPTPIEETILFTIDIDPGSSVYAALSATQDAKITISSKIPTAGITVDVVVKKDLDNTTVSNGTYSTSLSPFTATISNLLPGVLYTATFTVTSKSKPSNFAIKSFKVARK
jgi:hypothetical protein